MRKYYIAPEAEIELFTIADLVITASAGIGDGGNDGGDLDSVEQPEDLVDSFVVDLDSNEVRAMLDENGDEIYQEDIDSVY